MGQIKLVLNWYLNKTTKTLMEWFGHQFKGLLTFFLLLVTMLVNTIRMTDVRRVL